MDRAENPESRPLDRGLTRGRPWARAAVLDGGERRSRSRRRLGSRRLAKTARVPRARWPVCPSARAIPGATRRPRRGRRGDETPGTDPRSWTTAGANPPPRPWTVPGGRRTIRPRRRIESRAVLGRTEKEANPGLSWGSEDHAPEISLAPPFHLTKKTPFSKVILAHACIVCTTATLFPVVAANFIESSCILPISRGFSNF